MCAFLSSLLTLTSCFLVTLYDKNLLDAGLEAFFKTNGLIQLMPLRQLARPICGLMLLYRSIFLTLYMYMYMVDPYRASCRRR